MKTIFLQAIVPYVQTRIEKLSKNLVTTFDFATFEQELMLLMNQVSAIIVAIELTELLTSPQYLAQLKQLGSRLGMRFKEYRTVIVYLATGQRIQLPTPYFIKASPQRGRKKRGPNGRGAHLGLDVLGFMGRGSSHLVSEVVKMAVVCPSLVVAEEILAGRGVLIDKDTIHRFCRELAERGVAQRGTVSLSGDERLTGYTLVIGIDGGRLRERRAKRGRRKEGQKRQGYHGEWREPKLFRVHRQNMTSK